MRQRRAGATPSLNLAAALVLTGCLPAAAPDPKIAVLEGKVESLEKDLATLRQTVEMNQLFKDWEGVAYLTPGSDGYAVIRMDLGNLTVSLTNVEPYANGSRVTLQFGNLTSATIEGLKAKIEWGPVDAKGVAKNEEGKSREVSLNESMYSGTWNSASFVLEGIPPTALGFVRVRQVSHRAIRLRGRT